MKIYRGPATAKLGFYDRDTVQVVDEISADDLERKISHGRRLDFNVSKDGASRRSTCFAEIEHDDVGPMMKGLMDVLLQDQVLINAIKKIVFDRTIDDDEKLGTIRAVLEGR